MPTVYQTRDGQQWGSSWQAREHEKWLDERDKNTIDPAVAKARAKRESEARAEEKAEEKARYEAWYASLSPAARRREDIKNLIVASLVIPIVTFGIIIGLFFLFPVRSNATASKVTGFLGMKTISETFAMNAVRKEKPRKFVFRNDKKMSDEAFAVNRPALVAFLESGESYRMDGELRYGVGSPSNYRGLFADFEMWYNNETNVIKIRFKKLACANDPELLKITDSKEGFSMLQRTFYAVREDNQSYWLWESKDKERGIYPVRSGNYLSNFMRGLQMHHIINLNFLDNPETKRYHHRGGDFYRLRPKASSNAIFKDSPSSELRVFNNRPVHYYSVGKNNDGVEYEFKLNFYYHKIPNDKPTVAEWKPEKQTDE